MPIDETKCCNTHTKEKEKSGTCCQTKETKETHEEFMFNYIIDPNSPEGKEYWNKRSNNE